MKTRCPDCQTIFRVTPEQLKARAGQVRCGQCQHVFDALDSLLDEDVPVPAADDSKNHGRIGNPSKDNKDLENIPADPPLSASEVRELGKAAGLILPRETAEIPGYSRWSQGVMATEMSLPAEKHARWPFILVAVLLILALASQIVFHFRTEVAIALPSVRPWLQTLCQALKTDIPLPRHAELISIETSDLQNDATNGNLLILNATLRNRANYGQAYPSLELSLTDTQDAAIARRVFSPNEYLPAKLSVDQPFAASSDASIRLWIEAKDISAAGYRLYVFYP